MSFRHIENSNPLIINVLRFKLGGDWPAQISLSLGHRDQRYGVHCGSRIKRDFDYCPVIADRLG